MSKHTPGPWHYQEESDAYTHIVRGPNNEYICGFSQDSNGRPEADARLTAAAPSMERSLTAAWHLCQSLLACPGATPELIKEVSDAIEASLRNAGAM